MSWLSNTLGSVAGSVLGSAVQNHYNSANAAQANAWNVENYKHRYQWAVEDMRNAGLNPILAATNGIGGSISGASAASVGMSDIGSTMNSAKAASAAERQAKNAEHLALSQIDKNVAEADSVRQSTHGTVLQNGILANDLNFLIFTRFFKPFLTHASRFYLFNRSPWYDIFCDVWKFCGYAKTFRSFWSANYCICYFCRWWNRKRPIIRCPCFLDARFISREFDFFHCYFYDDIQIN